MWWAIGGAIFAAWWSFAWFVWWRGRRYKRVVSDAHLQELQLGIAALKTAAVEQTDLPLAGDDDARFLRTSEGIVLCYTIGRQNELFIHQLLVRHDGGPTTLAIARRVLRIALDLLDVDGEAGQLRANGDVFETSWRVGQEREMERRASPRP